MQSINPKKTSTLTTPPDEPLDGPEPLYRDIETPFLLNAKLHCDGVSASTQTP